MKKKIMILVCLILLVTTITGCTSRIPRIGYTVYPIEYLLKKIAGDKIELYPISDGTQVLRSQINSDYKKTFDTIDLLIHIGSLEPYLQIYSKDINDRRIETMDLSTQASIYEFKRYTTVKVSETESVVESKYYDSVAFDTIDTYSIDPYLWMDPIAMTSMARQIKDWLVDKYPEEKAFFEENYRLLETDLVRLGAEFQLLKNSDRDIKLVTMTPSFGNWQKNYGIQVYPVILSKYGVLPNNQQLNLIKQRIINDGVKYIVEEPNMPEDVKALFDQIKEELKLEVIKLNGLSYLTQEQRDGNKDYMQIMYENLAELENIPIDIVVPVE